MVLSVFLSLPCAAGEGTPLFGRGGMAVAYIDAADGSTIYLWGGVPVAYLDDTTIFGFNGRHLGWFEDGIVRNGRGERAGFTEETLASIGGTPRFPQTASMRQTRPVPLPPIPAPPRPAFADIDSIVPLRDLLALGRL
jgi:hypothetical protein